MRSVAHLCPSEQRLRIPATRKNVWSEVLSRILKISVEMSLFTRDKSVNNEWQCVRYLTMVPATEASFLLLSARPLVHLKRLRVYSPLKPACSSRGREAAPGEPLPPHLGPHPLARSVDL